MEEGKLITTTEMAAILSVPISWVYQHTRLGPKAIPFVRVGKYIRFYPEEVIAFYKSQQTKTNND